MDCILYKAGGTQTSYPPANGKRFSLEELQKAVWHERRTFVVEEKTYSLEEDPT